MSDQQPGPLPWHVVQSMTAPPPKSRRSSFWLAAGAITAIAVGIGAAIIPVPYAIISPGPATDVLGARVASDGTSTPRIVIEKATTYPTTGALDFTTVSVRGGPGYPVNIVDVLSAWIDPARDVLPVDEVFPPQATKEQVAEENRLEMSASQQEAAAVALRALGYSLPQEVRIGAIPAGSPSEGQLKVGDVLVSIGGVASTDPDAVRAAVQKVTVGDTVEVVVTRDGAQVTARPGTRKAADGRTVLGIVLTPSYKLPFPVTIDAGNVGGPSAGLMFSLGVYDKLTEGAMTGGVKIAGTGTISDNGDVGPIGGIRQKVIGAQRAGATYFLAPADNCAELNDAVPEGITVVKVESFEVARSAVVAIGKGDTGALPRCGS
ncbi:MAG TPA: PDZ domain-containing protein [Dermatophilaceae bacterium]|nr:PDZ domain-containing protein [Dermatophilaceae bacterium]